MISLLTTRDVIVDVRAWLVAAVCNGSRHYWRRHHNTQPLPPGIENILCARELVPERERLNRELIVRQALARLRPQERRILYLRYFDRLTVPELARLFGTTPGYAAKLVWKALRRIRQMFLLTREVNRQEWKRSK